MNFGQVLGDALSAAGQAGVSAARSLASASVDAASKAADLSKRAAGAAVNAVVGAVNQAGEAAAYVGRKIVAVEIVGSTVAAGAGAAVVGKGVSLAGQAGAGVYNTAKNSYDAVKESFFPHQPVAVPCLLCLGQSSAAARNDRINKRNNLIQGAGQSDDAKVRQAAEELHEDMKAVELARLSENTYAQFDPNATPEAKKPPEPWKTMTPEEAKQAGINPDLLSSAKAVVYTVPSDFPFEPKIILAFRGTTSETEDVLTDHDQALGMETAQYEAARKLGQTVGELYPDAEVTGHSLGGGKAQAAGVAGNLHGEMFNSAGLHPNSVGMTPKGLEPYAANFKQYRAEGGLAQGGGDPLTGLQNSPTAQKVAYGAAKGLQAVGRANAWALNELGVQDPLAALPPSSQELAVGVAERLLNTTPQEAAKNWDFSGGKWYVPPAIGDVRGLTSKNADGSNTAIASQHSITNLVYGFEDRKSKDIEVLLKDSGQTAAAGEYIGPMVLK